MFNLNQKVIISLITFSLFSVLLVVMYTYKSKYEDSKFTLTQIQKQNEMLFVSLTQYKQRIEQYQQQQAELLEKLEIQKQKNLAFNQQLERELSSEQNQSWSNQPVPVAISKLFNNRVQNSASYSNRLSDSGKLQLPITQN